MGRIRLSQRAHNVSCLRSLRDIAFFSRFPAVFALMSMPSPFMSDGSASSDCIRTCRGRGGRDRPEGPFAFASGRPPVAAAPMPPPISRCRVTYTSRHWLITSWMSCLLMSARACTSFSSCPGVRLAFDCSNEVYDRTYSSTLSEDSRSRMSCNCCTWWATLSGLRTVEKALPMATSSSSIWPMKDSVIFTLVIARRHALSLLIAVSNVA
mmetsp:Transcript_1962/g.4960  ORF Transcript_1962/g.4960 Transcript_1962/m.4960 type:complete len:210 (-) Transcript_1962:191-820(-)